MRETNHRPRIAVLGAGIAGLTAGWRLQRRGAQVVIFERERWLGGRTRTDRVDGYAIDAGIQLFGSMSTEFFRVARAAGAAGRLVRAPGRDALWRDGRAHEVVYGSLTSMVASGAVPFATKLRLGASYLPMLMRNADVLEVHNLQRAAERGMDRESIAAWGREHLGPDFVEFLAAPLLAAHYGLTPEETSAALYHLLAHAGMRVEVFAGRDGSDSVAEALATALRQGGAEVRLGQEVASASRVGRGVHLVGDGLAETFDGAVVALPAPQAAAVLGAGWPALAEWLAPVRYRATVVVALLLERALGVDYFGLSLPRREFPNISTLCVGEAKPGAVPHGRGLLVVFPEPAVGERLKDAEPRAVVDAVLPELRRVFPDVPSQIRRARVYRWPCWNVVFGPGYLERLRSFGGGAVEHDAPVSLAGDYLCVPGVEGAVRTAQAAADRLLDRLNGGGD